MTADLWRYYNGLDLRDLWRPGGGTSKLTHRLLATLVEHLPSESATKTAMRNDLGDERLADMAGRSDGGHGPFSHSDILIGVLITQIKWLIYAVYDAGGHKPKEPEPFPLPGMRPSRKKLRRNPQVRQLLQAIADEHARIHGYTPGKQAEGA